ncbi:MAG: DUF2723 domain-containing protein [Chloroflexota bacterium]
MNTPIPRLSVAAIRNRVLDERDCESRLRAGLTALLAYPALTTTAVSLLIYWLTLAPDLTQAHLSGDGGELITASMTLGVPHPTGYPTYILLGKLFSYLPIGTIAYRFNLFSAVTTTVSAGLLAATITQQNKNRSRIPAIVAPLVFAFTPLVWSQATITEVYGLNLLMASLFVWAIFSDRPLWLAAFLFGLAITTHATSALMAPLFFIRFLPRRGQTSAPDPQQKSSPRWAFVLGAFLLGLSPLLAIPWLAQTSSPVVWGNPTTVDGWWWLVSGTIYRPNMLALPLAALVERLVAWGTVALVWGGTVLVVWGVNILYCRSRDSQSRHHPDAGAASWNDIANRGYRSYHNSILLLTAVLITLYALTYNTPDAHVLLLPALLLLALPLADVLRNWGVAALLLPLALLLLNFQQQNLRQAPTMRPVATALLQAAPENAILLTPGDTTIFTLWYFHHVEEQRPDLLLVDANLFAFDWYRARLQQQVPSLVAVTHDNLAAFEQENKRPFCHTHLWNSASQSFLTCSEEPTP